MATLLVNPFLRYFTVTAALKGLAGGKLQFKEAGTDTNKAVYSDASGSTSLGSEVTLDSNGMTQVWLGEGAYKVILLDEDDNIIDTADNIKGLTETIEVDNLSELRALEGGGANYIYMGGHTTVNDGGQGTWYPVGGGSQGRSGPRVWGQMGNQPA